VVTNLRALPKNAAPFALPKTSSKITGLAVMMDV